MPRCSNFANLLAKSDGYRVETPIGSFAPKLKLLGEHTDPKTIHGRDIELHAVSQGCREQFGKSGVHTRKRLAPAFQYRQLLVGVLVGEIFLVAF